MTKAEIEVKLQEQREVDRRHKIQREQFEREKNNPFINPQSSIARAARS
jgi:hypothetical protein